MGKKLAVITISLFVIVTMLGTLAYTQPVNNFTLNSNGWEYREDGLRLNRANESGGLPTTFKFNNNFDQMFQDWWWYRSTGDTREYGLSNQIGFAQPNPTAVSLVYSEPINDGATPNALRFNVDYFLTGISPTLARLDTIWTVTNTSDTTASLDFFAYADPDLENNPNNDTGIRDFFNSSTGRIRVTDGTSPVFMTFTAGGGNLVGWEIDEFPDLRQKLTMSGINNLSNTTTPFGPDNVSLAFQWRVASLAPGQRVSGTFSKEVLIPEASSLLLAIPGLASLSAWRRRRRQYT